MILQGVKLTFESLEVGYTNSPKKAQKGGVCGIFPYMGMPCLQCARGVPVVQSLDVGKYSNPSFGPFSQVCCSITGRFLCIWDVPYFTCHP